MANDDNKDQPCMKCGAVLFSNARLDAAGHIAVNTLTQIELQQVEDDLYFKCPRCGAKNCVELETAPNGLPQLRFTHVKA
jgi:predicted nucleic-acid-binding Zn-ribbon protein